MLVKVTNEKTSFTVDDFLSIEEAKECFPNYEITEYTGNTVDFSSYKNYVKSIITKLPLVLPSADAFINEVKKVNSAIDSKIEEGDYTVGLDAVIDIRLLDHHHTILFYEWYKNYEFDDFCIGDLIDEDTW